MLIKQQEENVMAEQPSERHYQDVILFQPDVMYALTAKVLSDGSGQVYRAGIPVRSHGTGGGC